MEIKNIQYSERAEKILDRRKVSNQEKEVFLNILNKAKQEDNPKNVYNFIDKLSENELEILAKVNGMDSYNIRSRIKNLDYENAYNLIQSPDEIRDLNNDGLYNVGDSSLIIFPPTEAPESVKKAYDETTKNMSEPERMAFEMSMYLETREGKINPETGQIPNKLSSKLTDGLSYEKFFDTIIMNLKSSDFENESSYKEEKGKLESFLTNLKKFNNT